MAHFPYTMPALVLHQATVGKLMYYCDRAVDVVKVPFYKRWDFVHQMMVEFIVRRDNEQVFFTTKGLSAALSSPSTLNMACLEWKALSGKSTGIEVNPAAGTSSLNSHAHS